MTNILNAGPAAITSLEERSADACIVYRDHRLPLGCQPPTADIGIERIDQHTQLHVRRGVHYEGDRDDVRAWLTSGTKTFPTINDCMTWLRDNIRNAAEPGPATAPSPKPNITRLPPEDVTELAEVLIQEPEPFTPADLEAHLTRQVIGQTRATRGLAELAAHHVAKPFPRRPASALLIGPTGTGKTLAAEELTQLLTDTSGAQWSHARLDMNEFAEKHTQARLFGAPPGYIGYNDGHDLAATLRTNPRTVILFDEIDKAHPQIWHSLMNLMDAGRLSSQAGDIDARQSILLFTSNKDAAAIQPIADQPDDRLRAFLRDHHYPAEIVARMSRILVFKPLTTTTAAHIVILTVQRIVESYGLQATHIAPETVAALAGRHPLHTGGRDLEYSIAHEIDHLLAPLARKTTAVRIQGTDPLSVIPIDDINQAPQGRE